jgi:tetratricopeptide (TPR) repeat protein
MEELTGALVDRGIEVADRQNLDYVKKELNFQASGDVSDESAKSIGKFLGADLVITGQLQDIGDAYRYRASAISVEEATRASVTRLNVRNDSALRRMITALVSQPIANKAAKYGVSENTVPQTAGSFLDRGLLFSSRGDYEMAIEYYNEALRLNPNLVAAYFYRGYAYNEKRDYDRGIVDYTQAIRLDPNNAFTYYNRGYGYYNKGDSDQAIADYSQAIRLDPNYTDAYNNRGIAYYDKGDIEKAIADYTQAIRLNPNYALAYNGRGNAYNYKNDYDQAIANHTQAIRLDPDHPYFYYNRGNA